MTTCSKVGSKRKLWSLEIFPKIALEVARVEGEGYDGDSPKCLSCHSVTVASCMDFVM